MSKRSAENDMTTYLVVVEHAKDEMPIVSVSNGRILRVYFADEANHTLPTER